MTGWHLIGILGLALLMVVHEGGHFFVARAYGMRVNRFSIGFGPTFFKIVPQDGYYWFTTAADKIRLRLFRHDPERHGPTVYQVAMIPFLAYVQIAGMNPLEEVDPADKGSYANASLLGRILTIFSGPLANYLFASVLFFFSFLVGGRLVQPTDVAVLPDRPAAVAGIQDGDRIIEVDHIPVHEWEGMAEIITKNPNRALPVVVERRGEKVTLSVTPKDDDGRARIGVRPVGRPYKVEVSAREAAALSLKMPATVVRDQIVGIGQWVARKVEGKLSGPVEMVRAVSEAAKNGFSELLFFLGILSACFGALNLLPIPALDGGRLMFLAYEAATRRRPNARIEVPIHVIGLVMMLGLMVYVTLFNDFKLGAK